MSTIVIDRAVVEQAMKAMLNFPGDISDEMFESIRALKAALAEPAQEPAFHGFMSDDGTQVDVCFSPSAPRRDGTYATAYYTAPPQRKPLPKHDQHCVDVPGYGLMAVRLVRAVERAHGIKE